MQKIIDIVVTVFLLVAAVVFWLLGGGDYLAMRSGAMPVGEEGMGTHLLCFLTSVFSLILFIYRVVKYFTSREKKEESIGDGPAGISQFLTKQSGWLREWCRHSYNKDKMTTYLWVLGIAVVLSGIGILAGYPIQHVLTFHLPLGLLFGEVLMALFWPLISRKNNWQKILKGMGKGLDKLIPSQEAQADYFSDYFAADSRWELEDRQKNSLSKVTVGEKYWTCMTQTGQIQIIDAGQLEHIDAFEEVITVTVNNVRTRSYHYVAEFFNKNDNPKQKNMGRFCFETRNTLNSFIQLVQARTEGKVIVNDLETKKI